MPPKTRTKNNGRKERSPTPIPTPPSSAPATKRGGGRGRGGKAGGRHAISYLYGKVAVSPLEPQEPAPAFTTEKKAAAAAAASRPTFEQIVASSSKKGGYSRDKSYPARKVSETRITGKGTWAYLRKIIMYNENNKSNPFPATQFVLEKEYFNKKKGKKSTWKWAQTLRDLGTTIKQLQFLHQVYIYILLCVE